MNDIVFGILLVIAGLGLTFAGLRVFMLMLPVFGFVSGFFLGSSVTASWLGESLLASVAGWAAGIILGLLFASLSYAYWYLGAILATATVGAMIGMALMAIMNVNLEWVIWLVTFAIGALFAYMAIAVNLPVYVVLINTAIGGATMAVAGVLLLIGEVDSGRMRWGAARRAIDGSWTWWAAVVILAALGIASQWSNLVENRLPSKRWSRADASAQRDIR